MLGRLISLFNPIGRPVSRNDDDFAYNARSEVSETTIGGVDAEYLYDSAGNRTYVDCDGDATVYTANCLNQYGTLTSGAVTNAMQYGAWGNLTRAGASTYQYFMGLLTRARAKDAQGVYHSATFENDAEKRRRYKHVPSGFFLPGDHYFTYSGWSLQVEDVFTGLNFSSPSATVRYVWGKDLSGTIDGAGGVGGLLATEVGGVWYFPLYDNNGNVTDYVSETGEVVASYTYDAFGRTLSATGSMASVFPFRFSTKYYDAEADLYYYGYRYYSPELGRWLTRDPIEEDGGDNLYAFCGNNGVNRYDALGLYNKMIGDYIVTVDSSELSDKDFEAAAKKLIPAEFDKTMYGFTIPKNTNGKLNFATTSPAYEWEKIVGCHTENCWQLKKKKDGKYEIVQRLMQSKLNHLYIGVYSPLNTPSVSLKEHENTHVKHLTTYVQKMSNCYRCLSVLRVNDGQKETVDQYIKEMDKYYYQLALGISKKMDAIHYRRDLNPADVFGPFKKGADEALAKAKELAESSFSKESAVMNGSNTSMTCRYREFRRPVVLCGFLLVTLSAFAVPLLGVNSANRAALDEIVAMTRKQFGGRQYVCRKGEYTWCVTNKSVAMSVPLDVSIRASDEFATLISFDVNVSNAVQHESISSLSATGSWIANGLLQSPVRGYIEVVRDFFSKTGVERKSYATIAFVPFQWLFFQ